MDSIDALLQSKVKVDAATNKGSIIGVLKVLTGQNSSNSSNIFSRISAAHPELGTRCTQLRINGKGRETPVADAATLVEIVFMVRSRRFTRFFTASVTLCTSHITVVVQCPGKMARDFRRAAAETLCRLLRGDLSLIEDIQQRHQEVEGTDLDTFLAAPQVTLGEQSTDAMDTADNVHPEVQYLANA